MPCIWSTGPPPPWDHLDQDAQGKVPARTRKGGGGGEEEGGGEGEEDIEQLAKAGMDVWLL